MDRPVIEKDVKRLVFTCIHTVPHMEALLMFRTFPNQMWSVEEIAQRLYIAHGVSAKLLNDLCTAGFLVSAGDQQPPTFRYLPISRKHRRVVESLAYAHATNLTGITNLIHSKVGRAIFQISQVFK